MSSGYAPIIIFAYKRKDKLQHCLKMLEKNDVVRYSDLIIYSDGYKGKKDKKQVEEVQNYLDKYCKNNRSFNNICLYKSEKNKGLANSVIHGVSQVIENYGKAIIIEDDLEVSSDFLSFMNDALIYYEHEDRVGAIGGFTPLDKRVRVNPEKVLKSKMGCCWGWATWKDRWRKADWNINNCINVSAKERKQLDKIQYGFSAMLKQQARGRIDSWAVRWDYLFLRSGWWTIYPNKSKVANIGFDSASTHCNNNRDERRKVRAENENIQFDVFEILPDVSKPMRKYYKPSVCEKIYFLYVKLKGKLFNKG